MRKQAVKPSSVKSAERKPAGVKTEVVQFKNEPPLYKMNEGKLTVNESKPDLQRIETPVIPPLMPGTDRKAAAAKAWETMRAKKNGDTALLERIASTLERIEILLGTPVWSDKKGK
jgi:hypothetical protein